MNETEKTKKPTFQGTVVRQLAKILKETDLTEIEYEIDGSRIRVARHVTQNQMVNVETPMSPPATPPETQAAPAASVPEEQPTLTRTPEKHPGTVKSPMVGTTYLSPSPDDPTFVQVGSDVKEGDTLMIIEAMKVMNPIRAPRSGKVTSILVQNAEPVEFDQPLIIIE